MRALRRRTTLLALAAIVLGAVTGCTLRYSQTLVGRVVRVKLPDIIDSDSGIEVGLGLPGAGVNAIAFSEPIPSRDLVFEACEVGLAQVDYRGTYYAWYIAVNLPSVETHSYCVADPSK